MCLDNHLLSAYYDGEVSAALKEKISRHLAECSECREVLDGFSLQTERLRQWEIPEFSVSLNDMKKLVRYKTNTASKNPLGQFTMSPAVPLTAAAVVLSFFLGTFMSGGRTFTPYGSVPLAVSEGWSLPRDTAGLPVENMDDLLSLINQDEAMLNQEASMELPVNLSLAFMGDSEVVRSVSYAGDTSR